jgi:hypothetical protein
MKNSRLSSVDLLLPQDSSQALSFFESLVSLIVGVPGALRLEDRVVFTAVNPPMALPRCTLRSVDVDFPQILLETDGVIDISVGGMHLHSSVVASRGAVASPDGPWEVRKLLSIEELCRRLAGHVVRFDHFGINIPEALLDRLSWNRLLGELAAISAIYKYPGGKDWSFILPTTEEELGDDIRRLVVGREPKFELVYERRPWPLLQVSIRTDLRQEQVEALFPSPDGMSLPEVGQFFRSVEVAHPWPGLDIRFDLYYRSDEGTMEWETGRSLVLNGGRIKPEAYRN